MGPLHALENGAEARWRVGDDVPFSLASTLVFDALNGRRIPA
jgi:hypothetical protein